MRTLPASIAPVLVGTTLAGYGHAFHPLRFVATLAAAVLIHFGLRRQVVALPLLGIVWVAGSFLVQTGDLDWEAVASALSVGLLAAAIVVVSRRTATPAQLATIVYSAYPLAALPWLFGPLAAWILLCWLTLPLAAEVVRTVRNSTAEPALNHALVRASLLQPAFCLLLAVGILVSP